MNPIQEVITGKENSGDLMPPIRYTFSFIAPLTRDM